MEVFILAAAPFVLNTVMGAAKWLGAQDTSTPFKRTLLAFFAIVGAVSASALSGDPMNADSIINWIRILLESGVMFVAAHGTYNLFWAKKEV